MTGNALTQQAPEELSRAVHGCQPVGFIKPERLMSWFSNVSALQTSSVHRSDPQEPPSNKLLRALQFTTFISLCTCMQYEISFVSLYRYKNVLLEIVNKYQIFREICHTTPNKILRVINLRVAVPTPTP